MRGYTLVRLLTTVAAAFIAAGFLFFTHPGWFESRSQFTLPAPLVPTPSPGATAVKRHPEARPTATVPRINMTQHLDNVYITPYQVDHFAGARGMMPNLGDEFLVVHLFIKNNSTSDYAVHISDYQALDNNGVLDPPMIENFTRQRLREVRLIPEGYIRGVLVFEVPAKARAVSLIYQPDPLDPSKRKEWLLR